MSERVELAEALRSILEDSDSETEEQKENIVQGHIGSKDSFSEGASPRRRIKNCLTPINKDSPRRHRTGRGRSGKSALSPCTLDRSTERTIPEKRPRCVSEDNQTPPKKRRHANHVIILRQPRNKAKVRSSPRQSTVNSKPLDAQSAAVNVVKSHPSHTCKEFTVELESGIASRADTSPCTRPNTTTGATESNDHSVDLSLMTNTSRNIAENLNTPPCSLRKTPSSTEKYLDAAIDSQIKLEPNDEEIESSMNILESLDPTASPFSHFTATNQQQLYSVPSVLDLDNEHVGGRPWIASQEEAALQQLAVNQQLLQSTGNFYGYGCQPQLQGDGTLGRWVARGGNPDDSLTNITWLKRMSAPDLDPIILQTAQMMDPRFERPPYSYSLLIQFAISSSHSGKMTLREIYAWIEETFPYFKTAKAGWRNSIRHNLSLHKIFIREPPLNHGQPAYWTLRPGTVVPLPENRMFLADPENGGTLLQEVTLPSSMYPSMMGGTSMGPPMFMGGASPHLVMVPRSSGGMANCSSKENTGSGLRTKKPPLILPRGSRPYALVPVPLLHPPGQNSGQTPGEGPAVIPHILSPIIMGGVKRFAAASSSQMAGGRKMVPIAPKITSSQTNSSEHTTVQTGTSSSSSMCNISSGSDSGVDVSGQSLTSSQPEPSTSDHSLSNQATPVTGLPFKKRGKGRKSLPKIREDIDDTDGEDSFTAFFDQELASPPREHPHSKGMPIFSTPCKAANLQTWLSPLRGFTPLRNQPLDSDSGIFHDLHDDLPLTSFRTGLTPNFKSSVQSAAKHQRSRVGSLGEFGLPGLTPDKRCHSGEAIHNQSFGQIFGDLSNLDIEGEGLDVGNLSWTIFSPNK